MAGLGISPGIKVIFVLTTVTDTMILAQQRIIRTYDIGFLGLTIAQITGSASFATDEMLYAIALTASGVEPKELVPGQQYIRLSGESFVPYVITAGQNYQLESCTQFDWYETDSHPFVQAGVMARAHYMLSRSFVYRRVSALVPVEAPSYGSDVRYYVTPLGTYVESSLLEQLQEVKLFRRVQYDNGNQMSTIATEFLWVHVQCPDEPTAIDWSHWAGVGPTYGVIQCYPDESHYGGANLAYHRVFGGQVLWRYGEASTYTWYEAYIRVPKRTVKFEFFSGSESEGVPGIPPLGVPLERLVKHLIGRRAVFGFRINSSEVWDKVFDGKRHFDLVQDTFD